MSNYKKWRDALSGMAGEEIEHLPINYAIALGQPIKSAKCDEAFTISFDEGRLTVMDNGQSCCETRYMSTDDDLPSFVGERLVAFDISAGPDIGEEWGDVHEQMFVRFHTTGGTITLVTHNEHSGYYGGFDVVSSWAGQ